MCVGYRSSWRVPPQIIGVSAYVGHESFNEFVMPCVEQSLCVVAARSWVLAPAHV